ncbi:MAG: exosome protein [Candidatus Methanomethylophilaceae archaeon]|nr:exosome protein [Candidatus Methanomethylophilaceae archaeon]MBQ7405811.1 exosome protein [Candidatus Methanomethylophilaceae archaeon]MBQ8643270.1 exosome protein [Candidatus Methanomethylophilaceae archaeon]
MQVTFHWVRVQTFCYATEKRELLEETMTELLGTDEFQEDISEGEHGNIMTILETRLTKQREFNSLFKKLGPEICQWILDDIDNRIDEDCVFYMRLDKQKAVQGIYEVAHHGDVVAITGKVQSHPARKDVAVRVMSDFLTGL